VQNEVGTVMGSAQNPRFAVPDDLVELDQWVLWRRELRGGRATKIPYTVRGYRASSTNRRDWSPFEAAFKTFHSISSRYSGLGFVFSAEDPFVGIDLDDALDRQGNVKEWARGVVARFADTYMEVSPSDHGLKIWARGSLPANLPGVAVSTGSIEMYHRARYFTVTGRVFRSAPLQIEDHAQDLLLLYNRLAAGCTRWPIQPAQDTRIPYGQQHSTLVSLCGTLRRRRVCEEAIEACLQVVNQRQCEKPGPPDNVSRIVRSSRRWSTA
jgi:hypothetical protein